MDFNFGGRSNYLESATSLKNYASKKAKTIYNLE
jgi:hypothetical protein